MDENLAQEAVDAALNCNWEKAITTNSKILKNNSGDIDALNRIARAYAENGDIAKAKVASQKALKVDPTNPIALKSLTKWKNFTKGNGTTRIKVAPNIFIEEYGKTRVIDLINLGDNVISLDCGDMVKITPHTHRVNVTTIDDRYIGRFPDDLAHKFIKLMKNGENDYEAVVKSATSKQVRIFLRANSRSAL